MLCAVVSIIVAALLEITTGCYGNNPPLRKKCSESDSRSTYPYCRWRVERKILWCDRSNLSHPWHPKDNNTTGYRHLEKQQITFSHECFGAEFLYMNDSCVKSLNPDMLENYPSLKVISFFDNLITRVEDGTFGFNRNLTWLDLSCNSITLINQGTFNGAVSLLDLNLMHNNIQYIHNKAFATLVHLKVLQLGWNKLVCTDFFPIYNGLRSINLQQNNVVLWFKSRPRQFHNVTKITLDSNEITHLEKENFANFQHLEILYLRNNTISYIKESTFDLAFRLKYIDLRDNGITYLNQHVFENLCYLRVLRLSGNNLFTAHPGWFANVLRNNRLPLRLAPAPLEGNKWRCDCDMLNYLTFLLLLNNTQSYRWGRWSNYFGLSCHSPTEVSQKRLIDVTDYFAKSCHLSTNTANSNAPENLSTEALVKTNCHLTSNPTPTTIAKEWSQEVFPYMSFTSMTVIGFVILAVSAFILYFCKRINFRKKEQKNIPINVIPCNDTQTNPNTLTGTRLLPSCSEASYCSVMPQNNCNTTNPDMEELNQNCFSGEYFNVVPGCSRHSCIIEQHSCFVTQPNEDESDYMNNTALPRKHRTVIR